MLCITRAAIASLDMTLPDKTYKRTESSKSWLVNALASCTTQPKNPLSGNA